ncbi:hypothetical protein LCGC14_1118520 [marine sediment metagenome]|uniref:Uncharacterized protein n=1 Tax=marine sediment metagenome TaxID=412755 RepID=A0A0F9M9H7_9ZZZZ
MENKNEDMHYVPVFENGKYFNKLIPLTAGEKEKEYRANKKGKK